MRPALPLLLSLAACGTAVEASDDTGAGESDAAGCTALGEGTWEATGTCFGHTMSATLSFDDAACRFVLDEWSMMMDTPEGGTVVGDEVTLTGDTWDVCTGTISGDRVTGTCEDGCAFELARTD